MKEFIEKLIARLEEKAIEHRETGFEMERKGFSNIADKQYAKQTTYLNAIEIVNQLAEEYRQDLDKNSQGWIPCSERLPDKEGEYLVTLRRWNCVTFANFKDIKNNPHFDTNYVTAWQPLPAPYQPKGE